MKKIISFLIAVSFIVPSFAFAQTTTSLQTVYTNALQQLISLLVQEVTQLEQQLAALNAKQDTLQSEISSSTVAQATSTPTGTYTPSQTLTQLQQTAPQVVQTPPRPEQPIQEEAEVNLGQGFMRGSDFQSDLPNHQPTTTPGQVIPGEIVFICSYESDAPGLPNYCPVPQGSTSTLPQAALTQLTVQFNENSYVCNNGIPSANESQETQAVSTDANGNFSFTAPGNANLEDYIVNIYNGGQPIFWLNAHNATALPASAVCQKSGS